MPARGLLLIFIMLQLALPSSASPGLGAPR